jgi:MscS family membrane protein
MENNVVALKQFVQTLKQNLFTTNITILGVPLADIILASIILIFTQLLTGLFTSLILQKIRNATRRTTTDIDDQLITLLQQPLSWLILLAGVWLAKVVIADDLSPEYLHIINNFLEFAVVIVVAYIIYNGSPLLAEVLRDFTIQTENELDNLLSPYIPRIFRLAAILVVVLKGSEVFLGTSAGALVGLLGGAGVAIGLLLKDIIYDTFCTVIIYADKLYKPEDLLKIDGMEEQVKVIEIGLRSTSIYIMQSDSIRKIPNSKMISGVVENYSQKLNNPEDLTNQEFST